MAILMKRVFRYIFGILFLILGVLGLFLPILQGFLFLFIGLLILAPESKIIRGWIAKLKKHYPRLFAKSSSITRKIKFWKRHTHHEHAQSEDSPTPPPSTAAPHTSSGYDNATMHESKP